MNDLIKVEVQYIPVIVPEVGPPKNWHYIRYYYGYQAPQSPKKPQKNWHYIRFGTLSDGTITGMYCTLFGHDG